MNNSWRFRGIGANHSCIILLSILMALTSSASAADTMFRANPQHTGVYDNGGILPTNTELWRFKTGNTIYSSPAVSNGIVYVGSDDKNLYAIDAVTGTEKWRFVTGGGVFSSPAVFDGVVYIGSFDNNTYALDAVTGTEKWRFKTGNAVRSSPAVWNGVVYIGSFDNNTYAIDAVTGTEKWRFKTGNSVFSSPAVSNSIVYVGSYDNNLYAIDAVTGAEKWRFKTGWDMQSSPAVSNGIVYIVNNDNNLYAIDAMKGTEKWRFNTESSVYSSPAVSNGIVYVGSSDSNLYAIDGVTGTEKWRFKTGSSVHSSPAVSNGIVYVGSGDNNLYAIGSVTEKGTLIPAGKEISIPVSYNSMISLFVTILVLCIFGIGYYIYRTGKASHSQIPDPIQQPESISLLKTSRDLIFISSKSEDFDTTQQVYTFLKDRGYNVFFSQVSLPDMGSSDYRKEIDSALDASKHMIVVTSKKEYVGAPWVEAEWGLFINEKRSGRKSGNIITMIIGNIRIEDLPSSLRYYEVIPFDPESFEKILKYLN